MDESQKPADAASVPPRRGFLKQAAAVAGAAAAAATTTATTAQAADAPPKVGLGGPGRQPLQRWPPRRKLIDRPGSDFMMAVSARWTSTTSAQPGQQLSQPSREPGQLRRQQEPIADLPARGSRSASRTDTPRPRQADGRVLHGTVGCSTRRWRSTTPGSTACR